MLYILYIVFLIILIIGLSSNDYRLIHSFSLASSILSSTGLTITNSVFLNSGTNHFLIIFLMLFSLLLLPCLIIFSGKNSSQFIYNFLKRNKLNLLIFFFLISIILLILIKSDLNFIKIITLLISLFTTTGILPNEFQSNLVILEFEKYLLIFLFISMVGTFSELQMEELNLINYHCFLLT